jgi:small-conductance mechanosensitive channel
MDLMHLLAAQSHTWGPTLRDWLTAAAVAVVGVVVGRVVRTLVSRAARGDQGPVEAAEFVGRFVGLVLAGICVVYALGVLGVSLGPLVGTLGVGGLALAFAGQSILGNFLASIILQLRHPFRRGDQVSVGKDSEGTVDEVNFRTVVLRTFDGQRVMVPCADVLASPIINHTTLGRRRTTLALSVAYEADLEKALTVLRTAIAGVKGVLERPAPEVWVKSFEDSGIGLAVRFWHAPDVASLWRVRSAVAVAAKRALDEAGIDIPFPQRVLRFAGDDNQSWRGEQLHDSRPGD